MGNILKNHVECTCEEFVAEVAGKRRKPYLDALKSTFKTIVLGKSTLVKEMSSFLRENEGKLERKRVQELMSGWLNAYDFAALLNPYLLARSAADVTDEATLAVDFSDISKEFGGGGMEGMEMGYDGSRHCTAMGHDFISVSLVGAAYREAFPVYAKLGRGRHCHADLIYGAIRAVMERTGGLGWLVFDRGMDDARFLRTMKRDGRKAVVRVKDEGRDVFGDGRTVGEALADVPFAKAHLKTYRGDRLAEVRCRVGHVQYCADPHCKDAVAEDIGVLVVESRFGGKSLYLYVICPDEVLVDRRAMFAWAVRAAQAYCDRWQIETSFLTVKQEFALEKARVRTFRRLENIFALCMLAYVFMIGHIKRSKRFKRIVKALSDNAADIALKTHSLLVGIRTLASKARIRFISGRPRTRGRLLPGQLTLDLRTADGSVYRL